MYTLHSPINLFAIFQNLKRGSFSHILTDSWLVWSNLCFSPQEKLIYKKTEAKTCHWRHISYLFPSETLTNEFCVFTNQKITPWINVVVANSNLFYTDTCIQENLRFTMTFFTEVRFIKHLITLYVCTAIYVSTP